MAGEANAARAPRRSPSLTVEEAQPRRGVQRPDGSSRSPSPSSRSWCSPPSSRRCCGRSRSSLKSPEQISASNSPLWPADPPRSSTRAGVRRLPRPDRRHDARPRPGDEGPPGEPVRRSRRPRCRAHHVGGLVAVRSSSPGSSPRTGATSREAWKHHRLPAADLQHRRPGDHRHASAPSSPARWWRTASPASGSRSRTSCSCVLLSTIFLPAAVTLIPTYTIFVELGWVGHLAAAAGAGLLRQRLRRLPAAPVLHDAAARARRRREDRRRRADPHPHLDDHSAVVGRSSWRSRSSTSSTRGTCTSSRCSTCRRSRNSSRSPPASPGSTASTASRSQLVQAATLMTIIIPMVVFFMAQRFFMRGIVITGVEK